MDRILYLDGVPTGLRSKNVQTVLNTEDTISIYEMWFRRQDPPELTLDCRGLRDREYNMLLKFVEEYKGPLRMFATDPVPAAILSRFSKVVKVVDPKPGLLVSLRIKDKIPRSINEKIHQMFGVSVGEEEDDYE